ncbi:MAG: tellurite resistance TerB family protein [Dehalococcoidia bacterium]|nr:tellurite resistance TerB family protein [Dehalococcoidia bacterium]
MGLFDKVLGKDDGEIKLEKKEAFGAIAVAAVASDGDVSPEEVQRVAIDLMTLKAFRKADLRDLRNVLDKVASLIKKRGIGPVLQAAKAGLSKDELAAAFFVAVDLVLADGVVEDNEKKFLEELQRTIGMDDATAIKITEVVVIKNKA